MSARVAITGIGTISSSGVGLEALWRDCLEGRSGIGPIKSFDVSAYKTRIAAEVSPLEDLDQHFDAKLIKRADLFACYALYATKLAMEQSGLNLDGELGDETGVLIGSGIGGMQTWEKQFTILLNRGPDRVSPFLVPMMIIDMASGLVSMHYGARGPNLSVVTACATSTHALGEAFEIISRGAARAMIAGGAEAVICPTALSGFCAAGALSERNDEPATSCRPFDRSRDGFVMGEGSTIMVLEEMELAKSRGANILGEIVGYGMSGDAYHITAPSPDGDGAARAMRAALKRARLAPEDIAYVNAHAPGTPGGDDMEARGLGLAFAHGADGPLVSSTKSIHGHQLGATGATELALTARILVEGVVPPTVNCHEPDEAVVSDVVMDQPREFSGEYGMSNSFGFGGHNAVLIVKKFVD
ncbi:MAG: beta-ketoacyl-ACP synthase II [Armatimonadetes bacterium]|nr:beta-ketoacyl-ACP synthase II [Armatimonadota bacterium]